MTTFIATRRVVLGGMAGLAALGSRATRLAAAGPLSLNIIDVAGKLQLTQRAIEEYARAKPKLVSAISFSQAPAPELPGKIKAQQDAGRVDIDLVLTGTDALVGRHRPEAVGAARAPTTPPRCPTWTRSTSPAR